MLNVLLTGSVSFIITLLAIPSVIKIADQKKLFDAPDARKLHTKPIASLGGVGIFGGFILSCLLFISATANAEFQYFFAAATVTFFLGIKDDILIISPLKKFLGQVAAAAIVIHLAGIRIDSMHGLLGMTALPPVVGIALSYVTIIVIINAFNLIDGVDGLAGTLGLLTMSIFGAYFYMVDMPAYAMLAFAMAGSLIAFLIYNYNPAKIFMGDSGSLLLGLMNAVLVIKFITVADTPTVAFPIESSVAIGIAILMVPLADTLRVFSIRISQGRSPFSPDRNHIHHLLLDRGMNHKYVTLCCLLLNVFFISLAYFSRALGPTYLILSMVVISLVLLGVLLYSKKPAKPLVVVSKPFLQSRKGALRSSTKVVSINSEVAVVEN